MPTTKRFIYIRRYLRNKNNYKLFISVNEVELRFRRR